MTNHRSLDMEPITPTAAIAVADLASVTGGADSAAGWDSIKQQASAYCPATAAKYGSLDPSAITRRKAHRMGNECIAEMGPFLGGLARTKINGAIDQAFPAIR
jgi:hypothetical protein